MIVAAASENFEDLVKPEYAHCYEEIASFLFEQPESTVEQSGTFKV